MVFNNRNFWSNVESLANILEPAKNAVKSIERINTNMADVFIALIQMASAIKTLPAEGSEELKEFRKKLRFFKSLPYSNFRCSLRRLGSMVPTPEAPGEPGRVCVLAARAMQSIPRLHLRPCRRVRCHLCLNRAANTFRRLLQDAVYCLWTGS